MLSAAFASLIALKNGYTSAAIADAAVGGVTTAVGAIFILLAVGALIGTWNMAGHDPDGRRLRRAAAQPERLLPGDGGDLRDRRAWSPAARGRRQARSASPSSAWRSVMGVSEATAAGAVICGAYFGDKMTPLSETTILVPRLVGGGLTTGEHIRNMFWTAGPALGISLRDLPDPRAVGGRRRRRSARTRPLDALESAFNISRRQPAAARAAGRVHGQEGPAVPGDPRLRAVRRHPRLLHAVGRPSRRSSTTRSRARSPPAIKAIYGAMATGFVSHSGDRAGRRAVLPRRHGQPADDRLARPRRDGVRGDPRARRLPRAAAAAGRHARALARAADPRRQRQRRSGST